jgi:DNA-binding MarR family transcriptional regulator
MCDGVGAKDEPRIDAWVRLHRAQRKALAAVEAASKRAGFPPLVWYDVLLELDRPGNERGLRPYDLERRMLLAQYNLSRLIDRMEREGLVERGACPQDGRGQMIVITDAGRELRRRMWLVYGPAIEQALAALTEAEARQVTKLLDKLA